MTQPQDPRKHPLQDDEFALARVLRALPAGEPPAHLDAAVLRAATDALAGETGATRPRKPAKGLRWLPTWAIGTAAAAVLAVGVGLQLRPPLAPASLPQATFEQAPSERPEARERMSVDLAEPKRELKPMPGPPPAEPSLSRQPPAAPPPPPAPARDVAPAAAAAAPAAAAIEATEAQAEEAGVFAPPPEAFPIAESEAQANQDAASDSPQTLDRIVVSGSRLRADGTLEDAAGAGARSEADDDALRAQQRARQAEAPARILPPVSEDASLSPRDWIERIRDRRNQGDRAGARASLQLYLRTHPDAPVPTDLAQLR